MKDELDKIRVGLCAIASNSHDEAAVNTADMMLMELEQVEREIAELDKDTQRLNWLLPRQYDHRTRESIDMELSALTICPDCKNEVDLDVCHCGDSRKDHQNIMESGHNFVPVGCTCGYAKPAAPADNGA